MLRRLSRPFVSEGSTKPHRSLRSQTDLGQVQSLPKDARNPAVVPLPLFCQPVVVLIMVPWFVPRNPSVNTVASSIPGTPRTPPVFIRSRANLVGKCLVNL